MAARNEKAQGLLHEILTLNIKVLPQFRKTRLFPKGGPPRLTLFVAQLNAAVLSFPSAVVGASQKREKRNNDIFGRVIIRLYLEEGRISTTVAWLWLVNVFLTATS